MLFCFFVTVDLDSIRRRDFGQNEDVRRRGLRCDGVKYSIGLPIGPDRLCLVMSARNAWHIHTRLNDLPSGLKNIAGDHSSCLNRLATQRALQADLPLGLHT